MTAGVVAWFGVFMLVAVLVVCGFALRWRDRGLEVAAMVMLGVAVLALSAAWMVSR